MDANIAQILEERTLLSARMDSLVYGSPEIREANGKRYLYAHFREEGVLRTRYVGMYSPELLNVILENGKQAKTFKKRLREIQKELDQIGYREEDLDPRVAMNIDLARRNLVDSIFKQARLEGVATTYSDTETLVQGGKVNNLTAEEVSKVVNLKHAWDFVLNRDVLQCPSNYPLLLQINRIVEEGFRYTAGKIRSVPVSIGGSTYLPPLPQESLVQEELREITSHGNPVLDTALDAMLYVMKRQIFLDGNKRTAVLFANHILIRHGIGLLVVPEEHIAEFKKRLIRFYETDEKEEIKSFLAEKCCTIIQDNPVTSR